MKYKFSQILLKTIHALTFLPTSNYTRQNETRNYLVISKIPSNQQDIQVHGNPWTIMEMTVSTSKTRAIPSSRPTKKDRCHILVTLSAFTVASMATWWTLNCLALLIASGSVYIISTDEQLLLSFLMVLNPACTWMSKIAKNLTF
jgi:hypothetical protein